MLNFQGSNTKASFVNSQNLLFCENIAKINAIIIWIHQTVYEPHLKHKLFIKPLLNDRLIIYDFTSRSRIFHLHGDITTGGKELQNLGLCSALWAFEQGGIFIVPHPP
jgi:hypothetical protein